MWNKTIKKFQICLWILFKQKRNFHCRDGGIVVVVVGALVAWGLDGIVGNWMVMVIGDEGCDGDGILLWERI